METELESAMDKNLTPLRRMFQSSGVWAFNLRDKNVFRKLFSNLYGLFNVSVYFSIIFGETVYMISSFPDLSEVTAVLATALSGYLSFMKLCILYMKRTCIIYTSKTIIMTDYAKNIPLVNLVMKMDVDNDPEDTKDDNVKPLIKLRRYLKKSMDISLKQCRYIFLLNSFFVVTTLIGFALYPGFKRIYYGSTTSPEGVMYTPFRSLTPFDQTESPAYEIVYLLQMWASILTVAGYSGFDTFICWHFILIDRQYKLIIHLMTNLEEYSKACLELDRKNKNLGIEKKMRVNLNRYIMEEGYDDDVEKIAHKILTQCVDHYDRLMDLINTMNDAFSDVIFFQMLTSSILLCVVFFKYKTDAKGRFIYVTYTGAVLSQLILYCWYGQSIINVTSDISDHVYQIRWYKFSTRFQKSIVMLQRQYQRPITITARGMTTLSLPSFTSICSTAMSYLALLNFLLEEKVEK